MFARFPLACGVANVKKYEKIMTRFPAFVASRDCGDGFAEIAETILERRKQFFSSLGGDGPHAHWPS
jgi:hypothetical protein